MLLNWKVERVDVKQKNHVFTAEASQIGFSFWKEKLKWSTKFKAIYKCTLERDAAFRFRLITWVNCRFHSCWVHRDWWMYSDCMSNLLLPALHFHLDNVPCHCLSRNLFTRIRTMQRERERTKKYFIKLDHFLLLFSRAAIMQQRKKTYPLAELDAVINVSNVLHTSCSFHCTAAA